MMLETLTVIVPLLSRVALAVPLIQSRQSSPSITISNGTVIGFVDDGVESYSGIPFAQPPVGELRLRPPQPLAASFGTIEVTGPAPACPQFAFQVDNLDLSNLAADIASDILGELIQSPIAQTALNISEDCLYITVQRPAGTTSTSNLPVAFWIYGGGFEAGWSAMYDGTNLVRQSIALGAPVVYVAVGYRVNGFGFLAGEDLANEGSTNLGLRDQRLGLQWVAENIAAFGGDPDKVTIWGESAGAISAMDHTIINGGDHRYNGKPLFRAAILNSGSVVPAESVTSGKAQAIYEQVLASSSCAGSSDALRLPCLRRLPYADFLRAVSTVPGIFSYRSLDLSYLPRFDPVDPNAFFAHSPEVALANGAYAKVPVIVGNQEDEGTLFALVQSNITTNDELVEYLATFFPTNADAAAHVAGLAAEYEDNVLLGQPSGSPFRTGVLNSIYPQFKRLAAILGDITFTLTRRTYLNTITNAGVPAWSYLSTFLYGTPVLGTFHVTDAFLGYFLNANASLQASTFQTYFISFMNTLDPNEIANVSPLVQWPQWTNASAQLLNVETLGNTLLDDDFRSGAYGYLVATGLSAFRI